MSQPIDHVPLRLSAELQSLLRYANGRDLSLAEIEAELEGRGIAMLIVLLTVPFALPIPNPTSTIIGVPIILLGLRLALNRRSWLPSWILNRPIPHLVLKKIVEWGMRFSTKIERFTRPRLYFMHTWPAMRALIGSGVIAAAIALALPAVPFFIPNIVPATAILLLTIGLLEEDGLLILGGYFLTALCWAYLALVCFGGKEAVEALRTLIWPAVVLPL